MVGIDGSGSVPKRHGSKTLSTTFDRRMLSLFCLILITFSRYPQWLTYCCTVTRRWWPRYTPRRQKGNRWQRWLYLTVNKTANIGTTYSRNWLRRWMGLLLTWNEWWMYRSRQEKGQWQDLNDWKIEVLSPLEANEQRRIIRGFSTYWQFPELIQYRYRICGISFHKARRFPV